MKNFGKNIVRAFSFAVLLSLTAPAAWADLNAGKKAYSDGDYTLALQELKPLAESGDPEAQTLLGNMYANGKGVEKNGKDAASWYGKAAGQGNSEAQIALSDMFAKGTGVEKDLVLSTYWEWKAAQSFETAAKNSYVNEMTKKYAIPEAVLKINIDKKSVTQINEDKNFRFCIPYMPNFTHSETIGSATLVAFLIEADGKVSETRIMAGSGSETLDNAVTSSLKQCRFKAETKDGKAIKSYTYVKYAWIVD